ncbi:MAG: hypothetical protein JWQ66_3933 [Mucilaginibacter sp.]|nr:hypothetical protein [Mucilaginibacter sp.]
MGNQDIPSVKIIIEKKTSKDCDWETVQIC